MELLNSKPKTLLFWEGFPACGLIVKKTADYLGENLTILATQPAVPFTNLETLLGHKIIWLDDANDIWKMRNEFAEYSIIIHTGWAHKKWLWFDLWSKWKYKSKIVITVDNYLIKSAKQYLGAFYSRFFLLPLIDYVLVPGKRSEAFMKFLGFKQNRIFRGYYGASPEIYFTEKNILERKKCFLFVGQLIERKGFDVLVAGYNIYKSKGGKWSLEVLGSGNLASLAEMHDIKNYGFCQPEVTAKHMNSAECVILPSRHDNWGTVVCEAAACGCLLLVSKNVGSADDLVENGKNGAVLDQLTPNAIATAMEYISNLNSNQLREGSSISISKASNFASDAYWESFVQIASI